MIQNYVTIGFTFGISASIFSWIVGILLTSILQKTEYYEKLSNLNFITSKTLNQRIGLEYFKWIVKNTFIKFLNQGLTVRSKNADFTAIRSSMTLAEVHHLMGFFSVCLVAIYQSFNVHIVFGLMMMIPNVVLNLYPSLLQQENKRRLDRLIKSQNR